MPKVDLHATTDARAWAEGFTETWRRVQGDEPPDEGWMLGWFANAIEAGRSAGVRDGEGRALRELSEHTEHAYKMLDLDTLIDTLRRGDRIEAAALLSTRSIFATRHPEVAIEVVDAIATALAKPEGPGATPDHVPPSGPAPADL